MKKISFLMAIAITLLLVNTAQAQTATGTVSLTLNEVQSIKLNTTDISRTYATADDYANGKDTTYSNQLSCFSSSPFEITVGSTSVTTGMPKVTITPSNGSAALTGTPTYATATDITSISTAVQFVKSIVGSNNSNFNIEYNFPAIDVSANTLSNISSGTTYTADLTYTIVPQ